MGWRCSSVRRASDRHVANAGSILRCGKGFFPTDSTLSADSRGCICTTPCPVACINIFVYGKKSCSPCQSSVDYGNTKTPRMHRRLGSGTTSQLAFPGESSPNFPWEKCERTLRLLKKKKEKRKEGSRIKTVA